MSVFTPVYADFSGTGAATGPPTWGQQSLWRSLAEFAPHSSWQNLSRIVAVPRRRTLTAAQVANAVGALMTRHESLRTRVPCTDGDLRQITATSGRLQITIEAAEPAAADQVAHDLRDRLSSISFDYAADWPLRAGIVVVDDIATHLVVVFSHLAADLFATEILTRELRLLLLRGTISTPPGLQSIDLALRQQGVDVRTDERARTYWLEAYDRLPGTMFPPAASADESDEPWHRGALLTSTAVDAATRILATRHHVTTSTVLLAATASLLATRSGHDRCGLVTMSNNRYQTAHVEAIAKLNQLGLVVLEVGDRPDFAVLIKRAWHAALRAYQHSYYNPISLNEQLQELTRDRGSALEPDCYFDDIRLPGADDPVVSSTTEPAVRACLMDTTLEWTSQQLRPMRAGLPLVADNGMTWRFRLRLLNAPGAITLSLEVDTRYITRKQAELFLRDLEMLVVDAAFHDVPWPYSSSRDTRVETPRLAGH